MRTMTILGCVGIFLIGLAAPVQAEVVVNESIDLAIVAFVPCANGGAGESVSLEGPLHTLITFTTNGNNISGKNQSQPQGISGVGLTTGDRYQGTGVTQTFFKGSLQNGQFNQTFVNNFRLVGQGPGNNFSVHENFHLTVNANGTVTTVHDNFIVNCN